MNTADFLQLWLAYWSVMADSAPQDGSGGPPLAGLDEDGTGRRMFRRDSLRRAGQFQRCSANADAHRAGGGQHASVASGEFDPQTGLGNVMSRLIDLPQASGELNTG